MRHELAIPATVLTLADFLEEHKDKTVNFEMPAGPFRKVMLNFCSHSLISLINSGTIKVVCKE